MSSQMVSVSRAGRMRASARVRPAMIALVFAILAAMTVTAVKPADAAPMGPHVHQTAAQPTPTPTPITAFGMIRN